MKVILGIGNPLRGDDNIGQVVVSNLDIEGFDKILCGSAPENFLGKIQKYNLVVIVDAVDFNGTAGEVRIFEPGDIKLSGMTTHSMPLEYVIKFLNNSEVKIIGIQPFKVEFGENLSDDLKNKLDFITKQVLSFLLDI